MIRLLRETRTTTPRGQGRWNTQPNRRKLQTIIVGGHRHLIRSAHERDRTRGLNSSRQDL